MMKSIVFSQVLNIEKFRISSDSTRHLTGQLEFGFRAKKQDVDLFDYTLKSNVFYFSKTKAYFFLSELRSTKVANKRGEYGGFAHARIALNRKKITPEIFSQIQFDRGIGLDNRRIFGAVLREQLYTSSKSYLHTNQGFFYELETWENRDSLGSAKYLINPFVKFSANLTYEQKVATNVYWFSTVYFQSRPEPNYFFKPRLSGEAVLRFKVNAKISWSNSFTFTYDMLPVIRLARYYHQIKSTLTLDLNFEKKKSK